MSNWKDEWKDKFVAEQRAKTSGGQAPRVIVAQLLGDGNGINPVKNSYPEGRCPDCSENIPDDVDSGDSCNNCGHVFYAEESEGYDNILQDSQCNHSPNDICDCSCHSGGTMRHLNPCCSGPCRNCGENIEFGAVAENQESAPQMSSPVPQMSSPVQMCNHSPNDICDCSCHRSIGKMKHVTPCCSGPCPECGENVEFGAGAEISNIM